LAQQRPCAAGQVRNSASCALAIFLASALPSAATSESITGEVYAGAPLGREKRNVIGGSTPSNLESIGPEIGVDMVRGNFAFGGVLEGRDTHGEFGSGFFFSEVSARGGPSKPMIPIKLHQ
jgi:hypothetical protein